MKNKNKRRIFVLELMFALLLLTVAFFVSGKGCSADPGENLRISELLINGINGEEFIELYNDSPVDVPLKNYYFAYYSSKKDWDGPWRNKKFPDGAIIRSKDFFLIKIRNEDLPEISSSWSLGYSTHQLSDSDGSIALFPSGVFEEEAAIDVIAWGNVDFVGDGQELKVPKSRSSFERIGDSSDKWQESYLLNGTPGKENSKKPEDAPSNDPKPEKELPKIKINEIYPYPDTNAGEKEFIEIINSSDQPVFLPKCHIEDSKNHKSSSFEIDLEPQEIAYFEGNFALNNDEDAANLYCDDFGGPIDSVGYKDAEKEKSYSFDGTAWQWTSKVTKGKGNDFDKLLSGKIKKDKDIYADVYADFEVKTDKDAKKFSWNFGDGRKSSLKKTRHKYEKSGTYQASLKITGNGKSNVLNFEVEVKKFGGSKVRIASLSANPKGIDSKNEWIEIYNDTKKKVNLKDWSIATGWKKLYNHPIREDFIIKPGKSKRLTRDICAFTLANKQTKIELRYPNSKVADKLKYDYEDGTVGEDELYVREGKTWRWIETRGVVEKKEGQMEISEAPTPLQKINVETETPDDDMWNFDIEITPKELETSLGRFSENPDWQAKKENRIMLLSYNSNIKIPASFLENDRKVLGVESERSEQKEVHWAKGIIAVFLRKLNLFINTFFLKISL